MAKTFKTKNIEVTWNYDFKKQVQDNFSNRQLADMVEYIVNQKILTKIDKGISPVHGVRNFDKYKDPKKYPGDIKPSNKPNLALTGEMLSNYIAHEGKEIMSATVGIHKQDASPEVMTRARANNFGTQSGKSKLAKKIAKGTKNKTLKAAAKSLIKGIPARPFVPQMGQTFTRDIILEIRKAFAYCLKQAIQRGKNK